MVSSQASRHYRIKLHKSVTTEDALHFDAVTRDKIKRKIKELLTVAPEKAGEPLRFELSGYRKLVIFDNYRIVFRVDRGEVLVFILAVGIRRNSEVYREAIKRLSPPH